MRFKFLAPILVLLAGAVPLPSLAESAYLHTVTTTSAEAQPGFEAMRRFSGRVRGRQHAELGFELAGRVDGVLINEGERVEAGQVLVQLDTQLLNVEEQELRARKAEITAGLSRAEGELRRQRRLSAQGYSAQQRIDDLSAELQTLQAQLARNSAQLEGVALRRVKSQLTAPFSGEVIRLDAEEGVIVSAGKPILRLVAVASSEALFGIPASLKDSVAAGDEVVVAGEFGQVQARVLSVSDTVDPGTLTHIVRVELPAQTVIADGALAYLMLAERRDIPGFWLPLQALVEGFRGTWAVYAVTAEKGGRAVLEKRSVEPVYQQDGQVYVRAEFADGTQIVTEGVHRLVAGQFVSPRASGG